MRGNEISMIFQDPMTSLNPVHTVGKQLREAMQLHENATKAAASQRALEMLKAVGIPRAEKRLEDYPHQFSGGMRQRVMIAMALINNPDLLIADEPTTALDVTTQAQILKLMNDLQRDFGSAIILITHDLGVVAETADEVLVDVRRQAGRAGHLPRTSSTTPHHPYTWGLMRLAAAAGRRRARSCGRSPARRRRCCARRRAAASTCAAPTRWTSAAGPSRAFEPVEGTDATGRPATSTRTRKRREAEKLVAETMASAG